MLILFLLEKFVIPGKCKKCSFTNKSGLNLSAQLDLPESASPIAYAIFSHCFTCNKNYKAAAYVSKFLKEQGIATLRFDFPGLGHSEGDFSNTTLTGYIEDIIAASEFLRDKYEAPSILIGHSMGGAASILASSKIDSINLTATIAAPSRPGHLGERLKIAKEEARRFGVGGVMIQGKKYPLRWKFFRDIDGHSFDDVMALKACKYLVIHARGDKTVPYSSAEELATWSGDPDNLVTLDGSDHLLNNREEADFVASKIAEVFTALQK